MQEVECKNFWQSENRPTLVWKAANQALRGSEVDSTILVCRFEAVDTFAADGFGRGSRPAVVVADTISVC